MGRKRKYFTDEEIDEFNRQKSRKYYKRNRKAILRKRMQRYWESVDKRMPEMP